MLKSINLSLSAVCEADCIFCPSGRGQTIKEKIMSLEIVRKIVDEASSDAFRQRHRIESIILGESGDSLLHSDLPGVARYIKSRMPETKITLYSNFKNLTASISRVILEGRLIDEFYCNIDGASARNYYIVKKIALEGVRKNLIDFLSIRKELNNESTLHIDVLTLNAYIKTIRQRLRSYPFKLRKRSYRYIPDDFLKIQDEWKKFIDANKDTISRPHIVGWAERTRIDLRTIDYKNYSCPNLARLSQEAFIASDGSWYACCYDADNELVLGNVMNDSIDAIYSGQARRDLLDLLENKEFSKIGGPCRTVNCCQSLVYEPPLKSFLRKIFGGGYSFYAKRFSGV